jgi:hypothetical protein
MKEAASTQLTDEVIAHPELGTDCTEENLHTSINFHQLFFCPNSSETKMSKVNEVKSKPNMVNYQGFLTL